jgi:hypothetical protein
MTEHNSAAAAGVDLHRQLEDAHLHAFVPSDAAWLRVRAGPAASEF